MKTAICIFSFVLYSSFAANAGEARLHIPISGDSGKTISQLNGSLAKKGISARLPEFAIVSSNMSQGDVYNLKHDLSELADTASKYQDIEIAGAYGKEVEGKLPCFEGDILEMRSIYENMVDSFLSDQFTILAVSTRNPKSFGVKFDESDSGTDGSWINVNRCE